MAITSQDIVALETKLSSLRKELEKAYASFGATCAIVEGTCTLGACHDEWLSYETMRDDVGQSQKEYQHLLHRFEQITDKKGRIRETESQLRKLRKDQEVMASRLGASAWESYQNGAVKEQGDVYFSSYAKMVRQCEEKKAKGGFPQFEAKMLLSLSKRKAEGLFRRCGDALLSSGSYKSLPDGAIVAETDALLGRKKQLEDDLAEDRKSVSSLEGQTDKGRLEESRKIVEEKEKKLEALAIAYGKALYAQVPPDTIGRIVGQKGYAQGLDILAREQAIKECGEQIVRDKNRMEADELMAQNELDLQKIIRLKEQRDAVDKQILVIQATIQERKRTISTLGGPSNG
jgi:hypothetical protein